MDDFRTEDPQEAFDKLNSCEEIFKRRGYEEGIQVGREKGFDEGFRSGVAKGREIASEVGFYQGFARGWIAASDNPAGLNAALSDILEACTDNLNSEIVTQVCSIAADLPFLESDRFVADRRLTAALCKLDQLAGDFPSENRKEEDFVARLEALRAKYKHCCSLLGLKPHNSGGGDF